VWHARDFEAFIATCDPSIEFHTEFSAVGGGYHGHDRLPTFLRDWAPRRISWSRSRRDPLGPLSTVVRRGRPLGEAVTRGGVSAPRRPPRVRPRTSPPEPP